MYTRFIERHGWRMEMLSHSDATLGGIKEAVFKVGGDGAFGQYCVVLPEHDAVIAITGGVRDMQAVLNLVWEKLLPAMRGEALAADAAGQKELQGRLAGLTLKLGPASGVTLVGDLYALERMLSNIVENALNSADHTTLVAAVKAAGLVETLQGKGPFTVFAPTDDAFAALPAGTLDSLLLPENKQQLTDILLYHVVSGQVMAADVAGMDGQMADTALEGQQRAPARAAAARQTRKPPPGRHWRPRRAATVAGNRRTRGDNELRPVDQGEQRRPLGADRLRNDAVHQADGIQRPPGIQLGAVARDQRLYFYYEVYDPALGVEIGGGGAKLVLEELDADEEDEEQDLLAEQGRERLPEAEQVVDRSLQLGREDERHDHRDGKAGAAGLSAFVSGAQRSTRRPRVPDDQALSPR